MLIILFSLQDTQHDSNSWSPTSLQTLCGQSRTSATSPVNLVQLRRSYHHAHHYFARSYPALWYMGHCLTGRHHGCYIGHWGYFASPVGTCLRLQLLHVPDDMQTVPFKLFRYCSTVIFYLWLLQTLVALVMTSQTMYFRYELACTGFSTGKAQHLVTRRNDLCCFIGLTLHSLLN